MLRAIIVAPSNPFVSIDPILALRGMRDRIAASKAPVIGVSPIIGGKAVKGPAGVAAKAMSAATQAANATGAKASARKAAAAKKAPARKTPVRKAARGAAKPRAS